MTTPIHVRGRPGDVAPVVLLVGDPARATRTAESLDGALCYNEFRGLLGYTGTYHGVPVSVQTTGMGCPSAAIVCEELAMLDARILIRMGTCGAVQLSTEPKDVIIATAACPLDGTTPDYLQGVRYAPAATFRVVRALVDAAEAAGLRQHTGVIATEDALYAVREGWVELMRPLGVLAQEMEASAIFTVAALRGLEAGCILVASNRAGQQERLPDDQLQPAIDAMIRVGLEAAVALSW
ncbi:MAG: purine-nucleoside phosphorylase [Dehalococcoidia bacterium]